ncbi:hypothetical protein [Streptomyces bobili]|uniref:hypothetical protein n=1 Tax=Streptomyces bobili TaxID=67280 RepID=UPI00382347DC
MTRTNPHVDEAGIGFDASVAARGWQAGYDAGIGSPPDVPKAPPSRDPDYVDAWAAGAAAGNADGQAEGWRLWPVREDGAGIVTRPPGAEPQDSGETGETASAFDLAWKSVGVLPLQLMLSHVAPEADRNSEAELGGRALNRALHEMEGVKQPYLPVCLQTPHELSGDPVLDAGYWHGSVSESFEEAGSEARGHAHVRVPHFPGVVRYRSAGDHNFWDWLPLDQGDHTVP